MFVFGSEDYYFISFNGCPANEFLLPLGCTGLIFTEDNCFLFNPLDKLDCHHRFSSPTRQDNEPTSCLTANEYIFKCSFLIVSELHISVHKNLNVWKFFAVIKIKLLHDRYILLNKSLGDFEVIPFNLKLNESCFFMLTLFLLLFFQILSLIVLHVLKLFFLYLLLLDIILSNIFNLLRYFFQMIIIYFFNFYLFNLFNELVDQPANFLSRKNIVFALNQGESYLTRMSHVFIDFYF